MPLVIPHTDGVVEVEALADGRRRVTARLVSPEIYSPKTHCETHYGVDLIAKIVKVKGAAWVCGEIERDENAGAVQKYLETELQAYFQLAEFSGKRVLDFGCGAGASTMLLARMLPASDIVGVDLMSDLLGIAEARLQHYGYERVSLRQSPHGLALPDGLGQFDLVIMSAVYEHLLPVERRAVTAALWQLIRPGGYLFLNQTPNVRFPIELHTTMLPLINYLPDVLTHWIAQRCSDRVARNESWESLLRRGIRGASVAEIRRFLGDDRADLLSPRYCGMRDRVDLWMATSNPSRMRFVKRVAKRVLKLVNAVTGVAVVPDLSLAFHKPVAPPR